MDSSKSLTAERFDAQTQAKRLLGEFKGSIDPVKVPPLYKIGIFIVALAMVLLPLIYIALIIGVGYAVYYHATEHLFILSAEGGGIFRLLVYLAPIAIGGILIYFMIKPLFIKTQKMGSPVTLNPSNEPLLFSFVEKICVIVGAPIPQKIDVNCDVNAFASFRRGILSFTGNDLALTIGLPLVAGVNLKQFAGILAHEFGHFAQGTGMRFTYIIRSISYWFARVVHERDSVDSMLKRGAEETDIRIGIVLLLARFFVGVTSKILWFLMVAGNFISSFMLRQMEFDADRYEVRLAGSDAFESTVLQLRILGTAFQYAHSDLSQSWNEGKLANNLPSLTIAHAEKRSPEVDSEFRKQIQEGKTGTFDTHPCDKDRIENARKENADGIFHLENPARELFNNFEEISQQVTYAYYKDMLGDKVAPKDLLPTNEILNQQDEIREGDKVLGRYFQEILINNRPLLLKNGQVESDFTKEEAIQNIQSLRNNIEAESPNTREAFQKFRKAEQKRIASLQAQNLLEVGFTIRADDFGLNMPTIEGAREIADTAKSEQEETAITLNSFEESSRRRMQLALNLLQNTESAAISDNEAFRNELAAILPALSQLEEVFDSIVKLNENYSILSILLINVKGNEKNEALFARINRLLRDNFDHIKNVHNKLGESVYPFHHATGKITLSNYFLKKMPERENMQDIYIATETLLNRFYTTYYRILGRLAMMAESVETSIGLPLMQDPLPFEQKEEAKV